MNDTNSLSHTKWNCKYHIVFAPKYRRRVFYGEKRREIGKILIDRLRAASNKPYANVRQYQRCMMRGS